MFFLKAFLEKRPLRNWLQLQAFIHKKIQWISGSKGLLIKRLPLQINFGKRPSI
jgi:hypothetical protein